MELRHELKFIVPEQTAARLCARLSPVMRPDGHSGEDGYLIRSLYFDDMSDSAFADKEDGQETREKFRLRIYDGAPEPVFLEKKLKIGGYTRKERAVLTRAQAERLMSEDDGFWFDQNNKPLGEFLVKRKLCRLRPRQIVDYRRTAYICEAGNVRITIDRNLSAPLSVDLYDDKGVSLPALGSGEVILEIKYDGYLPGFLAQAAQMDYGRPQACSKYVLCRLAAKIARRGLNGRNV